MNENKNQDKYKTMTGFIILSTLLLGLILGVVLGIQLTTLSSIKVGYWEGSVDATDIIILMLRHQIRSSSTIRTTIRLGNTGGESILATALYITHPQVVEISLHILSTPP